MHGNIGHHMHGLLLFNYITASKVNILVILYSPKVSLYPATAILALQNFFSGINFHPCGKGYNRLYVHVIIQNKNSQEKKFHLRAGGKNGKNILQAKISGYMALLRHSLHEIAKPYIQVSSTVSTAALTASSPGQPNIPPF